MPITPEDYWRRRDEAENTYRNTLDSILYAWENFGTGDRSRPPKRPQEKNQGAKP